MNTIKRKSFLKMSALAMLAPLANGFVLQAATQKNIFLDKDNEILKKMVAANDMQAAKLLQTITEGNIVFSRKIGQDFATLAAAYVTESSLYYHSQQIVPKLEILTRALASQQSADGTVNIANLESPPDTAFLVELLSAATFILVKDNAAALQNTNNAIKIFLQKAGDGLTTGGVHTPNHRWVICAALAKLNALYPNKKYVDRIEDWLGEGIFMDADGHYPERSASIYAVVEDNSLITMARLLHKPALLEYVRKNLEMTYFYIEPNGDIVTADSRRQDQWVPKNVMGYYLHYRYMAIKDNNKKFAAIAKQIENTKGFEEEILNKDLFHFLENSLLQQALPQQIVPSDNYEKLFTTSKLLRIRRGTTTATLFGGVDWPLIIASGRSCSPDFFSYRKGNAILKYMRLSTSFFGLGYFYSDGLKKEGNKYVLQKKLTAPYYQPLPKNLRNNKGDYKLVPSTDGRFWNKMDFENRPVSNVKTQDTSVSFVETNGAIELNISVKGLTGVPVTIELCFAEGGKLTGVTAPENGNSFLEKEFGEYEMGGDVIRFGPGAMAHKKITNLEGERYSTHFGSLRTEGMHIFITGVTPFNHTLTFS
ncbi:hypothetical protein [Ferruginibacter sp.]|nr:hypothetical protein [Ferruginibacter sp.]